MVLTILSSCNLNGSGDKYMIEGTVKNFPAKSIYLEKLGLQQVTVVDSAKIDDKGTFSMQGVSEKGFYRVKLDEKTFWLFLLEPAKYKMDIDLSAAEAFKVTGPEDNDEFQAALKKLNDAKTDMMNAKYKYMMYEQQKAAPDSIMMAAKEFNELGQKFINGMKEDAKKAKSPLVAMFYITNVPLPDYPKENLAVIERLEKEMPGSSYAKDFRDVYNKFEEQSKAEANQPKAEDVSIGKPAPEIDLKNPDGKNIKLSSLKGKVVLIDFWASWCGPCRMEMPNVVAAYNKYKSKGFTVYSVSLDKDANAWVNAIKSLNMTWENQVSDLKWWQSEAAMRYGVNGIPAAFLIDKDGIIVAANLRGAALDQKIAELIK